MVVYLVSWQRKPSSQTKKEPSRLVGKVNVVQSNAQNLLQTLFLEERIELKGIEK